MTLIGIPIVALYLGLELWVLKRQTGSRVVSTRQDQAGSRVVSARQVPRILQCLYRALYSLPAILAWLVIILAWWIFRNV